MECAKPGVPRRFIGAVVAIKKAVVQLMEKVTYFYAAYLTKFEFFKSCV